MLLRCYLLLVPVMWSPFPFNIQWSDGVFLILFGCFIAASHRRRTSMTTLDYLVLGYLLSSAVSLVHIEDSAKQGIELLKLAYLGLIYLVIGTLCADGAMLEASARWTAWITMSVAATGLLYLLAFLIWPIPAEPLGLRMLIPYLGNVLRLDMTFPGPELLGCYLTAGVPFAIRLFMAYPSGLTRCWIGMGMAAVVVVEIFTFSHSWVGFATAGLLFCWPIFSGQVWRVARTVLAVGIVGLFAAMLFASTFYVSDLSITLGKGHPPTTPVSAHADQVSEDRWQKLDISATYSFVSYHLLKILAWETFLDHPMTGVGRGNFDQVSNKAAAEGRLVRNSEGSHPHMALLGQLAETGALGGIALLVLWAGAFSFGRRLSQGLYASIPAPLAWASLAALAGLFVNGLHADIMNFRFLWIILGFLRGLSLFSARPSR